MPVLKQSNDTKIVQNHLKLSFLPAELLSVQLHGSFIIVRKLFTEGTVGGKKKFHPFEKLAVYAAPLCARYLW